MLVKLEQIQSVPGLMRSRWKEYLNVLMGQADRVVKEFTKRDLELTTYPGAAVNGKGDSGYYSGTGQRDLILRQYPVQSVQSVYFDPAGFWGQAPNAFAAGTLLTQGVHYSLAYDYAEGGNPASSQGMLRRIGGSGVGSFGFFFPTEGYFTGKLSAYRLPIWPYGDGNVKVSYQAGYSVIPPDITNCVATLVAWFVRNQPSGAVLSSESLGAYSYSVMSSGVGQAPELGSVRQILVTYREPVMSGWRG